MKYGAVKFEDPLPAVADGAVTIGAMGRRLAVVMHRMWVDGTLFDCMQGEPLAA